MVKSERKLDAKSDILWYWDNLRGFKFESRWRQSCSRRRPAAILESFAVSGARKAAFWTLLQCSRWVSEYAGGHIAKALGV